MLCYSVNPIYDLQAINVFKIVITDKDATLPKYHSMKICRGHGDNTVGITEVGIKWWSVAGFNELIFSLRQEAG